jgi:hypothetical protein
VGCGLALWEAICGPASRLWDREDPRIGVMEGGLSGVMLLEFDGWDVAEVAVQALGVVPVHPAERCQLDRLDGLPRADMGGAADQLGFVVAVDRLGQRVVIAVADRSDRRSYAHPDGQPDDRRLARPSGPSRSHRGGARRSEWT